jgi:N-methylhydantoinase B
MPGAIGEIRLNDADIVATVGKEQFLRVGDTLTYRTPGGGGYGNPLRRAPDRVAEDVRLGYVSAERALADYGVIVDGTTFDVDAAATGAARQRTSAGAA